jgi:hypothetical protein
MADPRDGTVSPTGANSLVVSFSPAAQRNDFGGGIAGFRFTAGAGLTYNRIGLRVLGDSTGLHTVTLYDASGTTVLRQANVDCTGGGAGVFLYAPIPSITLTNGAQYLLVTTVVGGQTWADAAPTALVGGWAVNAAYYDTAWHDYTSWQQFYGVDLDFVGADTGAGAAAGTGAASATGRADKSGRASSAGTGTASAVSLGGTNVTGQGAAAGTGTAAGTGRADLWTAGAATGLGAATSAGRSDVRTAGASAGLGTATGASSVSGLDRQATGSATGLGIATSVGRLDVRGTGIVLGTGSAVAVTVTDIRAVAAAAARGTAAGALGAGVLATGFAGGQGRATASGGRMAWVVGQPGLVPDVPPDRLTSEQADDRLVISGGNQRTVIVQPVGRIA